MATCISRRAQSDRASFRLVNDTGKIGKYVWLEYRCPNKVSDEGEVCKDCSYKLPKYKYQSNQKCNHGLIGGPYPPDSKLFNSPYYLNEIKSGWKITEQDELRAKEAVDKANSNMPPRKKVAAVPVVTETPKAVEVPKAIEVPKAVEVPKVTVEVKKKRPYNRKPKVEKLDVLLPVVPVLENPLEPKFIEVVAPPITITDFVVVKVKKMKVQGKDYYHDAVSGKLYGISVNGVGAYKGRYKEEEDEIDTTFPDSDNE